MIEWIIVVQRKLMVNFQLYHGENKLHFDNMIIYVRFILDQDALLDFYSASSLKKLGHIILILIQSVFTLTIF